MENNTLTLSEFDSLSKDSKRNYTYCSGVGAESIKYSLGEQYTRRFDEKRKESFEQFLFRVATDQRILK